MNFLLGRRGVRLTLLVALGSSALPGVAHAFCRTTTAAVPPNYDASRFGCYTDGLLLYWRNACVSYSINGNGSATIPYEEAKRVIDLSFQTWMDGRCSTNGEAAGIAVTNLGSASCDKVLYNDTAPNQNLIVFREDGWPYNDGNNTLGLTTVTFNAVTGEIYDADMEINASGKNLTTTEAVPASGFDLQSVVTHEAGHFLGLAHATDSRATMFAAYKPGTTALRSLTDDDVDGLCAIYPSTALRTVSTSVSSNGTVPADACDSTPRHGLGSSCLDTKPKETCAVASNPATASWGAQAGVALALGGMFAARRRRSQRA